MLGDIFSRKINVYFVLLEEELFVHFTKVLAKVEVSEMLVNRPMCRDWTLAV